MLNFFKNKKTGIVFLEMGKGPDFVDENLELLVPNSMGAAPDKHLPIVTIEDDMVVVRVGKTEHSMTPEHYIEGVFIQTSAGGVYCDFTPEDVPEAKFSISPDEVEAVYAYCNLHGLWKAEEPIFSNRFEIIEGICSPEFSQGCITSFDE